LAYLYLQTEDFDGARRAARELIELGRDPVLWLRYQGRVLTRQHRYQEALERYNRAAALAPEQVETYTDRAATSICLGHYPQAIADYTTALNLGPESRRGTWARYRRATPLWMTGRLEEAVADYLEVRTLLGYAFYVDARLFLVLRDQARHLRQAGQVTEAAVKIREAREALEVGRRRVAAGSWLEKILACLAGELAPEDLVRSADPREPEHICEAFYYAAEACLLDDRVDEALAWFRKCVETGLVFDPDSSTLVLINEYHLARWRLEQSYAGSTTRPAP
jgi:tetratricopeptide (TPR) repeat protein